MNEREAMQHLAQIIDGIDRDESETPPGWWETSTGAAFGARA